MATKPSVRESEKLRIKSKKLEYKKFKKQTRQDKPFVNEGQGVIPERIWRNLPGKGDQWRT